MTARTFLYSKLVEAGAVYTQQQIDLDEDYGRGLEERVFAKKSMTSAIEDCPYIVFKLGNNTTEGLAEESEDFSDPSRQFVQVWVHDFHDGDIGDYMQIDAVIKIVKAIFRGAKSPADGVIAVRYLETSQDLNDETLNTLVKYIRFQLVME